MDHLQVMQGETLVRNSRGGNQVVLDRAMHMRKAVEHEVQWQRLVDMLE